MPLGGLDGKGTGEYEEQIVEPIETARIGFEEDFASCESRSVTCIACKFPRIALHKELTGSISIKRSHQILYPGGKIDRGQSIFTYSSCYPIIRSCAFQSIFTFLSHSGHPSFTGSSVGVISFHIFSISISTSPTHSHARSCVQR